MKKKKLLIWTLAALLIVGAAAWRLWPRSIDSLMGRPGSEADAVAISLQEWTFEEGPLVKHFYTLNADSPEESRAIMDIISRGRYRASFANLLPWTWGSYSSGKKSDGRTINVDVSFDDTLETANMTFLGHDKGDVNGRRIWPVGNEMFEELAEYIKEKGEEQEINTN